MKATIDLDDGSVEVDFVSCDVHTEGKLRGDFDVDVRLPSSRRQEVERALVAHLRLFVPDPEELLAGRVSGPAGEDPGLLRFTFHTQKLASKVPSLVALLWGSRGERKLGTLPCNEARSPGRAPRTLAVSVESAVGKLALEFTECFAYTEGHNARQAFVKVESRNLSSDVWTKAVVENLKLRLCEGVDPDPVRSVPRGFGSEGILVLFLPKAIQEKGVPSSVELLWGESVLGRIHCKHEAPEPSEPLPEEAAPRKLELGPPPRAVPLLLSLRMFFGSVGQQVGWLLAAVSAALIWGCSFYTYATSLAFLVLPAETAQGLVTKSVSAGFTEGGRRHSPGTPVYVIRYKFTTPDGAEQRGVCYQVGSGALGTVTVEYPRGLPSASCVKGARRTLLAPIASVLLVIPAVSFFLLWYGWDFGRWANRLLGSGHHAVGKFVSKKLVYTKHQKGGPTSRVYQYTYRFVAEDGESHEAKGTFPDGNLLYDAREPSRALLIDRLPCRLEIDEMGRLDPGSAGLGLAVLILPAIALAAHGLGIYARFLAA